MKRPCIDCPFRKTAPQHWLGEAKATQIVTSTLEQDKTFPCHKTVNYKARTQKQMVAKSQICAGSVLLHQKEGRPNFVYRFIDDGVSGAELIVDSKQDFINLHK